MPSRTFGRPEYDDLIAEHPLKCRSTPRAWSRPSGSGTSASAPARADPAIAADRPVLRPHTRTSDQPRPRPPSRAPRRHRRSLRLVGLRRDFGGFKALKGLDLTIEPGEFMALLGPSGCGKTDGAQLHRRPAAADGRQRSRSATRRIDQLPPEQRGFGMVFQSYALFPHMTARKNVGFGLAMQKVPRPEADDGASMKRWRWCGSRPRPTSCRARCRAASSSASPSPAPS